VILGPGEDAGVVALPAPCDDLALVLAHESHNHPSQVLPVEGAATGVGGIVRDVACMGAEVVGVLDALRFGDPESGVIPRDVAVSEAPSHGLSVIDYAPRARGARAYVELCMEVLERE
jgi:phosphoribosylformylglycinamidine (FGAM) synthase-like enzyme